MFSISTCKYRQTNPNIFHLHPVKLYKEMSYICTTVINPFNGIVCCVNLICQLNPSVVDLAVNKYVYTSTVIRYKILVFVLVYFLFRKLL